MSKVGGEASEASTGGESETGRLSWLWEAAQAVVAEAVSEEVPKANFKDIPPNDLSSPIVYQSRRVISHVLSHARLRVRGLSPKPLSKSCLR